MGVVALLTSLPAAAADLPIRPRAYKALPQAYAYSWSGCYVGGNVGGLWVRQEFIDPPTGVSHGSHDASSVPGGVQGGCNYQLAGGWVLGIQGDYDWSDADGNHFDPVTTTTTIHSHTKSLASVTGRIGYAWDRLLGYVKGGAAWERDRYDITVNATGATFATARETRGGWTVGIGAEYAFSQWLTAFLEYDHYGFDTRTIPFDVIQISCGCTSLRADIRESKDIFKVGINLKLSPAGALARY